MVYAFMYTPFVRDGEFYSHLDIQNQFVPWRVFYKLALERGELGTWNPFLSRGYPHHAEGQSGILHPAHILLYFLLPVDWAAGLEMAMYMPFALIGMLLFLRKGLRCSPLGALTGAALFGFSTFFHMHLMHVNMVWVYAHLPYALWAIERIYHAPRSWRWILLLGGAVLSMLLLGHPQMVWFNALSCAIYVGYLELNRPTMITWNRRGQVALCLVAVGLIGCVQLLPTWDFLQRSSRKEVSRRAFENYSLPPLNLALNLSPHTVPLGYVGDDVYDTDGKVVLDPSPEFPTYFGVGTITLLFSFLFLYPGRRRTAIYFGIVFLVILLFALGRYGGLIPLQRAIPLISRFRCPLRYAALIYAFFAILVAVALTRLETIRDARRLWVPAIPVALAVLFTFLMKTGAIALEPMSPRNWLASLYGPVVALLAAVSIVASCRSRSALFLLLLAMILIGDIATYNLPIVRQMNRMSFETVRNAKQRMTSEDHSFRHYANNNTPVLDGHYLANGYLGIPTPERLSYYDPFVPDHARLASIAVGHFTRKGKESLVPVPGTMPRVRLAPNLKSVPEPLGADLHKHRLTETALCHSDVDQSLSGPPIEADESVSLTEDGFAVLRIAVHVKHPRLVVLSDRYWPYWQAWADGKPRDIIPLYDKMLRGVIVHPGESELVMRYQSNPLRWGIYCAFAGVLLFALAGVWSQVRGSRS